MESAERDTLNRSLPSRGQQETSQVPEEMLSALDTYKKLTRVAIRFKAVGNAPIMKENMYKIALSSRFQSVIQFLRTKLGWKTGNPLFTNINLAFAPALDDTVASLFKSFATDGYLIVNYSTTPAWG